MELDPRIKSLRLEFPIKTSSSGLKPMRTYYGRVLVEVSEPVAVNQLRLLFEGWERVDFGAKIGAARKLLFRSAEDLLQTDGVVVDTIVRDATFEFACTMPNVNFPAAMRSAICEVAYTMSATLIGSSRSTITSQEVSSGAQNSRITTSCANHITALAAASVPVQLAPKVVPSGVGWLKPMIMRDGIMLSEPVRRRFRKQTVQTAMNICLHVRNHCCTLGESILVDVDATMLQRDRVLTFVRAAVIEQVSLKTHVQDAHALESIKAFLATSGRTQSSTVVLAERTLNRKVSEIDPGALSNTEAKDWDSSSHAQPLVGLHQIENLRIRVPRRDVCTAEGHFLSFSHVLRLTFGLTSRPSKGQFDTKYATKDVPLRLVTSKFGDVGRMSQVEINKRLSALSTENDGSVVSAAFGYLLNENSRVLRPMPLESYDGRKDVPAPILEPLVDPSTRPYTPAPHSIMTSDCATPTTTNTATTSSELCTPIMIPRIATATNRYSSLSPSADSSIVPPTPMPAPLRPMSMLQPPPFGKRREKEQEQGFQFGPLPPIPRVPQNDSHCSDDVNDNGALGRRDLPALQQSADNGSEPSSPVRTDECVDADNADDSEKRDSFEISRPSSSAESVLYIASHTREVDEEEARMQNNRDTLVEMQPASASLTGSHKNSSIASHNATSSDYDFSSARSHASILDDSRAEICGAQSDSSSTENTSTTASVDERRTAKQAQSDKRESSRSEGETIVFSPRSECFDPDGSAMLDGLSTRSSSPEPKHSELPVLPALPKLPSLPSLPVIDSLDDLTKGMLNNSSVFSDEIEFSSFWTTGASL
ncbi:hypothetical protein GGF40_000056 [Coemansia sp. RSA 1286]|nr:hypothetical protein GGF39_000381 [Coemansia sp. RSA 1721]KAJ2640408.1 hypothetical protein GGF40_000056 [Coemansia sp. RSA 1286]